MNLTSRNTGDGRDKKFHQLALICTRGHTRQKIQRLHAKCAQVSTFPRRAAPRGAQFREASRRSPPIQDLIHESRPGARRRTRRLELIELSPLCRRMRLQTLRTARRCSSSRVRSRACIRLPSDAAASERTNERTNGLRCCSDSHVTYRRLYHFASAPARFLPRCADRTRRPRLISPIAPFHLTADVAVADIVAKTPAYNRLRDQFRRRSAPIRIQVQRRRCWI